MSAGRHVRALGPSDEEAYTAFLEGFADSLLYYSLRYGRFLEDLLGCRSDYFIAIEDGRITGLLPLMQREGTFGRVINSLPYYGSNGGVVASSEWARASLVGLYNEIVSANDVAAATLVSHPLRPGESAGAAHDLVDERISQITSLDGLRGSDEAAFLARIDGSARRNIKKAESSGIRVSADATGMSFLEKTHRENMAEIRGRAKSPEFFASVPNHFNAGTEYDVYVARCDGQEVAALLVFYHHRTVEYYTPVTRADARERQPMAMILRHAMLEAASRGYRYWNWGGTWLAQQGVYRFKKKWGADARSYQYYVKVNQRAVLHAAKDDLLAAYPDFFVVPFGALVAPEVEATAHD